MLYNYLAAAYKITKKYDDLEKITIELYEKFPDYLFAKLGYVNLQIEQGNLKEVPKILNHTFNLKRLMPNRKIFHVSEVCAFCTTMALYNVKLGDRKTAKDFHNIIKTLNPEYPDLKQLLVTIYPVSKKDIFIVLAPIIGVVVILFFILRWLYHLIF